MIRAAIIPFYNEEKFIKKVVLQAISYVDFIIAVNDGSTDNSLKELPSDEKIILVNLNNNSGKGYAINCGVKEAVKVGADAIVTLDADMQHPPELIPHFFDKLRFSDVVIGNRMSDLSKMPFQRILSNKITSYLISKKIGVKIPDSQCGYRGYKLKSILDILPKSKGYEAETEIIIKAARKNLKFDFVSIPTIYGEENSKIKPIRTILAFCKTLLKN